MDEEKRLSYFFLGFGIGVAIGILFAPKSGEETRGMIVKKADESKDYLRRRGDELKSSASDMVERGKGAVDRQREHLAAAVEAGKQAYREAVGTSAAAGAGSQS